MMHPQPLYWHWNSSDKMCTRNFLVNWFPLRIYLFCANSVFKWAGFATSATVKYVVKIINPIFQR